MKSKSRLLSVALLTAFLVMGFQGGGKNLIRNGDFERWAGTEPAGWETTNIPKTLTVVSSSSSGHGGKSAVRLDVKDFFGTKIAGLIIQKDIRIAGKSLRLTGEYILHQAGGNVGFVTLDFQNAEGSTVGTCEQYLRTPKTEFASFTLDYRIPQTAIRLDVRCSLLEGNQGDKLHEGSYLLLDDLRLVSLNGEEESAP